MAGIQRNTLSNPTAEDIENEREEQFAEMYYSLECNICGEIITTAILAGDFNRPGLMTGPESFQRLLIAHNEKHYEAPVIYACEDDDVFGVTHIKCTHRIYRGA
jgi:hypothetical protein